MTTSNPIRGTVTIKLDRDRTLKLGFNALVLAEQIAGINLAGFNPMEAGLKGVRAALYAGLAHEDPKLTLDQVGDMIQEAGYSYCVSKLIEGLAAAFKTDEKPDPNAQPTTVSGSASPDAGVLHAASGSSPASSGS
jgi:hypothetical protein